MFIKYILAFNNIIIALFRSKCADAIPANSARNHDFEFCFWCPRLNKDWSLPLVSSSHINTFIMSNHNFAIIRENTLFQWLLTVHPLFRCTMQIVCLIDFPKDTISYPHASDTHVMCIVLTGTFRHRDTIKLVCY